MTKKIAILQSNYLPWKGYFDIIASVDEFIFYDEMQYTKNDWRNRNKIKTVNGSKWITIPIYTKGHIENKIKINQAKISDHSWSSSHWSIIRQNYCKAPYFDEYAPLFKDLYSELSNEPLLCKVNYCFIKLICDILKLSTKLTFCEDYGVVGKKTESLIDLIQKANGTEYISGPSAKSYIDESLFDNNNITLTWMDYSHYKEYPQLYPPFEHNVSIIDLIFNCGPNSLNYIKSRNS